MQKAQPDDQDRFRGAATSSWPANPSVPVSWGELLDKVTILEIKERRLRSPDAIANVARELELLRAAASPAHAASPHLDRLKDALHDVNEMLWDIEDRIRAKEADKTFDSEFVELARAVYIQNDRRGDLKRRINALMNSELVEEKQYTPYERPSEPTSK